jgi:hypothetical protein
MMLEPPFDTPFAQASPILTSFDIAKLLASELGASGMREQRIETDSLKVLYPFTFLA